MVIVAKEHVITDIYQHKNATLATAPRLEFLVSFGALAILAFRSEDNKESWVGRDRRLLGESSGFKTPGETGSHVLGIA